MAKVRWSGSTLSVPTWCNDFLGREHLVAMPIMLDADQFRKPDAVLVKASANAVVDAVAISVDALSGPIPSGTILDFGAKKFAQLTADAAEGATSVAVEALATQIDDNDEAWYEGASSTLLSVPSGTAIGRTIAERDAGDAWGPAASTDDEIYLIAFDIPDLTISAEAVAYRHGGQVKENFLPNWTDATVWPSALKTAIRSKYACYLGEN
jgi:hypothetical protein